MSELLAVNRTILLGQGLQAHVDNADAFVYLNEECRGYTDLRTSLLLPRLFETIDKKNTTSYLKLVYERVINALTNRYYSSLCSDVPNTQYIETIIGSFLYPFICIAYAKYCYIKKLELSGEAHIIGAKLKDESLSFISGGALAYNLHRDQNLSTILYTKIADFLAIQIKQYIPLVCEMKSAISPDFLEFRDDAEQINQSMCLFLTPTGRIGQWKLNRSKRYSLLDFKALISDVLREHDEPLIKNEALRADLRANRGKDEFETLIYTLLADFMPYQCLENFVVNQQSASEYVEKYGCPKAIVTGQGLLFNYLFSFWVAQCRFRKTPFYISQHGGVYGECEQTATEYIERKISDNFLSWGWHDKNVIALDPTKRLSISSKIVSRVQIKKYDVLIVSTFEPLVVADYVGMYGYKLFDYYRHQARVINILLQSGFRNIYLRAYPGKEAMALKLMELSERIKLVNTDEDILLQMSRSKLVLFDYLGASSFIDALRLNIPSLVVYDNKITKIRVSARENYELAEKAKIVMDITHFKKNIFDIKKQGISRWWHAKPCSSLKIRFIKNQYGFGKKYMKQWRAFFETLC